MGVVRLASRPGQVEGADLAPGTRIVVSAIHNVDSRLGSANEILGTLDPNTKAFFDQEVGDLVVLQSCVDAGAPRAAVVGEPQPEDWSLNTVVIWSSSGENDDVEMEDDDDDDEKELECQILEWNGRRMQWKVQILPHGAIFWADIDELTPKPITAKTLVPVQSVVTPSVVPSPQRPNIAEMMRRAGSLANFSPAPTRTKEALNSVGGAPTSGRASTGSSR